MRWDPAQYLRYADLRGRPFVELTGRIAATSPSYVVDIGCGTGELTALLGERWPEATVVAVDSSPDMVDTAQLHALDGRLSFECADLRDWRPSRPVDVVTANAVLQWVPDHLSLLADIAGWLAPDGWLAFQVPDNFTEPSHTLLRDLRLSPRWRDRLAAGADRTAGVETPETYLRALVAVRESRLAIIERSDDCSGVAELPRRSGVPEPAATAPLVGAAASRR